MQSLAYERFVISPAAVHMSVFIAPLCIVSKCNQGRGDAGYNFHDETEAYLHILMYMRCQL